MKRVMIGLVVVLLAGFLAAASYGAQITACVTKNGRMTLIGAGYKRDHCLKNETLLTFNTEGPQGKKGDPGTDGICLCNPSSQVVTLWDDFTPVSDETLGEWIDVEGFSSAQLQYNWIGDSPTHTCQYKYQYSSDGVTVESDSTFLYFLSGGCLGDAAIPLSGVKYMRIGSWSSPLGLLNATLTLNH